MTGNFRVLKCFTFLNISICINILAKCDSFMFFENKYLKAYSQTCTHCFPYPPNMRNVCVLSSPHCEFYHTKYGFKGLGSVNITRHTSNLS